MSVSNETNIPQVQLKKEKPTQIEMAKEIMQNMKARIDLLRSHKALVNRLMQTAQGPLKPLFLVKENLREEALLREARSDLNLWIQQGGRNVEANPTGVYLRVGSGVDVAEGVAQAADKGESFDKDRVFKALLYDLNDDLYTDSEHSERPRRQFREDFLEDYAHYIEMLGVDVVHDAIVYTYKNNDLYGCSEYWCDDPLCWLDQTTYPNV